MISYDKSVRLCVGGTYTISHILGGYVGCTMILVRLFWCILVWYCDIRLPYDNRWLSVKMFAISALEIYSLRILQRCLRLVILFYECSHAFSHYLFNLTHILCVWALFTHFLQTAAVLPVTHFSNLPQTLSPAQFLTNGSPSYMRVPYLGNKIEKYANELTKLSFVRQNWVLWDRIEFCAQKW
jgi:hypothetical protein